MATTLPHLEAQAQITPVIGQPFNFSALLDGVMIPRVIAADAALLPGARLMWGVIRQMGARRGSCFASDKTLARAVGVGWRQVVRYCRALERAGLLKTTARPGKTPIRELLWESRFAAPVRKGVSSETGGAVLDDRGGCPTGQTQIRSIGNPIGILIGTSPEVLKKPSPKPAAPPAQKPAEEWTEEDYIARGRAMGFPEHVIARDLERLRARRARPQAERMVKASEISSELEKAIQR